MGRGLVGTDTGKGGPEALGVVEDQGEVAMVRGAVVGGLGVEPPGTFEAGGAVATYEVALVEIQAPYLRWC